MSVPNHIGFIVDGNRRWAREKGLPTLQGHEVGFSKVLLVTDCLLGTDVKQVTYYLFSTENWKRTREEVSYLMNLGVRMVESILEPWARKNIRVRHIGEKNGLPQNVQRALQRLEERTENNTGLLVNLAINYGGKLEIVQAVNSILQQKEDLREISEEDIDHHLYNPESNPVDVIVRTSGEQRISNFLLWQSAYAELIFLDKYWPDMEKSDVDYVLEEFQKGGVGKTTTALNLAFVYSQDRKVLLVDIDAQGNATTGLGVTKNELKATTYDVLINDASAREAAIMVRNNLYLIPANLDLAGAETRLKAALEPLKEEFDMIIIDTPPSLGLLTVNALVSSDWVLVPIQCEFFALEGVGQLLKTVNLVKKYLNGNLDVLGFLLTMYDRRTRLSQEVEAELRAYFRDKVFRTVIPRSTRVAEAPSYGQSILEYDRKNKLGKGLNALLGDNLLGEEILQLDPSLITTSPFQPRSAVDDDDIDDLAESLKKTGVLQPILVRGSGDKYELIAGERRWRAAIKAGLEKVPVIVKNVADEQAMIMALVENLQRKDLNPIEVARACKQIIDSTGMTQEELAEVLGMSRSNFTNLLRLLDLPEEVQTLIQKGDITVGHAKVLLSLKDGDEILKLAKVVAQRNLSVRELEQLCKTSKKDNTSKNSMDPHVKKLKQVFAEIKSIPVKVYKNKNGYSVTISFSNPDKAVQLAEYLKQWETLQ